jgi:hypothetical protein
MRPEPQRVLAITDRADSAVLEWAHGRGITPTIVVWGDEGDVAAPDEIGPTIARGGVVRLPVDLSRTDELVAVAGPIIAWT